MNIDPSLLPTVNGESGETTVLLNPTEPTSNTNGSSANAEPAATTPLQNLIVAQPRQANRNEIRKSMRGN